MSILEDGVKLVRHGLRLVKYLAELLEDNVQGLSIIDLVVPVLFLLSDLPCCHLD